VACVCDAGAPFDGLAADFVREAWVFRIVVVFLMQELCGNSLETTIAGSSSASGCYSSDADLDNYPSRHHPQAHVDCLGRVGQQADGNEINPGIGVGTNIFQTDATGTL
jgi:hypothetical protein